jgi:hypothetical protein
LKSLWLSWQNRMVGNFFVSLLELI